MQIPVQAGNCLYSTQLIRFHQLGLELLTLRVDSQVGSVRLGLLGHRLYKGRRVKWSPVFANIIYFWRSSGLGMACQVGSKYFLLMTGRQGLWDGLGREKQDQYATLARIYAPGTPKDSAILHFNCSYNFIDIGQSLQQLSTGRH